MNVSIESLPKPSDAGTSIPRRFGMVLDWQSERNIDLIGGWRKTLDSTPVVDLFSVVELFLG